MQLTQLFSCPGQGRGRAEAEAEAHSIYEATLKPWLIFANLNPSVYCSAGISGHQKLQGIKRGTHGQVVMMIRQEIHIYANARAKAAI